MVTFTLRIIFIVLMLAHVVGCIAESNFRLSDESRLPKWFELPAGKSREDVTVTLYYYVNPGGRDARLFLKERDAWLSIDEVSGMLKGLKPLTLEGGSPEDDHDFEVMSAEGITDIIEHRGKNDLFYMVDDPAVWKELGVEQR